MPLPTLESFDRQLARVCADVLGEPIGYKAAGSDTFVTKQADVRYGGGFQTIENLPLVESSIFVRILKADVPAKPNRDVRLMFAKRPGQFFRPTNVDDEDSGDDWTFHTEEVIDG